MLIPQSKLLLIDGSYLLLFLYLDGQRWNLRSCATTGMRLSGYTSPSVYECCPYLEFIDEVCSCINDIDDVAIIRAVYIRSCGTSIYLKVTYCI